jgi:hypothetical protein
MIACEVITQVTSGQANPFEAAFISFIHPQIRGSCEALNFDASD